MRRFGSTLVPRALRHVPHAARVAVVVLALAFALEARAQSASDLNTQGMQALGAGRYDDAVQALDASYRKDPKPIVLYNLGLAYKGGGHPDRALEAFENYVKFANAKKDASTLAAARSEIDKLKSGYARYVLKVTPPDAALAIDGVPAQPNHGELWVQSGRHKVTVHADGYESYEQALDVAAGRFDLEIHLREVSGPPEVRAATLIDEGVALQAIGNLDQAIDKFKAAEGIYPSGHAEALLGLAEESSGDLPNAYTELDLALKKTKDKYVKTNKKKLTTARSRVKGQLATLNVSGSPIGAEVFVNGKSVGLVPFGAPIPVAAGSVTVTVKKQGYEIFEQLLDLPRRSVRTVMFNLNPTPPPPVVIAAPPPKPPPAPPPVAEQPIPALEPVTEPPTTAQADIEAGTEPQPEAPPEELTPPASATGFEMAFNFGYEAWLGRKTDGSAGTLNPQIVLGARLLWPLSFGVQLNGGFDLGDHGTSFVANVNPGFYVRGHTGQHREPMNFDAWAGVGLQPLAMQIALLKANSNVNPDVNPNAIAPNSAQAKLLRANAGVDRVHTLQSINLPFELGATFFITESLGVDLGAALTLWFPEQSCIHAESERLCQTNGLKQQTSLFVGGGLTLLP